MGLLGAMAGFGQGLQDYAKVMQKKEEQDWLDKQAQAKFEREKNFELLRMQNQQTFAKEQQTAQFTHAKGLADDANNLKREEMKSGEDRFNKTFELQGKQLALQESEAKANAAHRAGVLGMQKDQLELQKEQFSSDKEFKDAQKKKIEEETRQSKEVYDMKMNIYNGLPPESLAAALLGKEAVKLNSDDLKLASQNAAAKMEMIDEDQKKELIALMKKGNKGMTDAEAMSKVADGMFLRESTMILNMKGGGGKEVSNPFPSDKSNDPITVSQDSLNKLSAMSPADRESYYKTIGDKDLVNRLKRQLGTGGSGASVGNSWTPDEEGSGVLASMAKFATRNTPGGSNTTRSSIERANPKEPNETKLAYELRINQLMGIK